MKAFLTALPVFAAMLLPAAQFQFGHRTLIVPDGFVVEEVAGPPLIDRPIMADFDEQGRLYVADSAGVNDPVKQQVEAKPHRIIRLEDTDGDGRFDRRTIFADKLMFPEGILWHDGAVYCGAPPTIWRLKDTDNDGVADERTPWFEGETLTGCANDLHGPYLGPDGWIYWCKGAFAKQTHERAGGRPPISDSASHIFRCRADRSEFDSVMVGGMDNPVEVAFGAGGDVFFTTTFFAHPGGGERDAVVHAVYGGVYPKPHGVLDGLIRTGELMPALAHLGPAVPCGLMRYEAKALGQDFEDNLFSCQFNLHKVQRHVLEPQGGTYRSRDIDFLTCDHPDFHPTDVLEDADGSLLVVDTGGWYKLCCPSSQIAKPDVLGAIFRIRRSDSAKPTDPRGLKLQWNDAKELAARLDDPRTFVRRRAIAELAKQGAVEVLAKMKGGSPLQKLNRVWALTRIDSAAARQAVRESLSDSNDDVRQAAIHATGIYRDAAAVPALLAILKNDTPRLQRSAATSLGQIGDKGAVAALLTAAAREVDRFYEHAMTYALIEIGARESIAAGLTASEPRTRRAALIALDQLGNLTAGQVTPLLGDKNQVLRETAVWIAGHRAEWADDLAGFFRSQLRADLSDGERAELEAQLSRFAQAESVQTLMVEALASAPVSSRQLVVRAMGRSGVKETPSAWWEALQKCLSADDAVLRQAAVASIRSLPKPKEELPAVTAALLRLAGDTQQPDGLRLEAVGALPSPLTQPEPELFKFVLSCLRPERPPLVRNAAAQVVARSRLTDTQLESIVAMVRTSGPFELPKLLESFKQNDSEVLGRSLLAAVEESKGKSSVRSETLRVALEKMPTGVKEESERVMARLHGETASRQARLEELAAACQEGNPELGHALFNSAKTACATCHAIGYVGGKVGPDLSRIGSVRSTRDLLEAVVFPNASFVRSFEPMIVATRDGEEYSGILHYESADRIRLVTGPNAEQQIRNEQIVEIRPGTVSLMPEGLDQQLSKADVANLIAFLRSLK